MRGLRWAAKYGRLRSPFPGYGDRGTTDCREVAGLVGWKRVSLLGIGLLVSCASPQVIEQRATSAPPRLAQDHAVMPDGYRLPLRTWTSDAPPTTVVLGLHGFNDYGKAFASLGQALARRGITTYAIDQRGFGESALPGRWHGSRSLAADLHTLVGLLRAQHPRARLYVAGESMGGAVAMVAASQRALAVEGLILIAPAVWSRDTMPWYQRLALQTAVQSLPGLELTGRGLPHRPTDNRALLSAMAADPLVIKATRVDALWGVTELMDAARAAAPRLQRPVLLLYGERDQIIPRRAFCRLIRDLAAGPAGLRLVLYRRGWHMLPRDLQGGRVHADIAAWLADPIAPLPSGEETTIDGARIHGFCNRRILFR